jgi:hypothetical protein
MMTALNNKVGQMVQVHLNKVLAELETASEGELVSISNRLEAMENVMNKASRIASAIHRAKKEFVRLEIRKKLVAEGMIDNDDDC